MSKRIVMLALGATLVADAGLVAQSVPAGMPAASPAGTGASTKPSLPDPRIGKETDLPPPISTSPTKPQTDGGDRPTGSKPATGTPPR